MTLTEKGEYTYKGETYEYSYGTTASLLEQAAFVAAVTDVVVTEQGYIPLLLEVMFRYRLVQMFTSVDTDAYTDKDGDLDIDKFDEFDKESGISSAVFNTLDDTVAGNIITSLQENIAYKTGSRKDGLSSAIIDLIKLISIKIASTDIKDSLKDNDTVNTSNTSNDTISDLKKQLERITRESNSTVKNGDKSGATNKKTTRTTKRNTKKSTANAKTEEVTK